MWVLVDLLGHLMQFRFSWSSCRSPPVAAAPSPVVSQFNFFDDDDEDDGVEVSPAAFVAIVGDDRLLSHADPDAEPRLAPWKNSSNALAAAWLGVSMGTWPLLLQLIFWQFLLEQPSKSW